LLLDVAFFSDLDRDDKEVDFTEYFRLPQRLLVSKDAHYIALKVKGESMSPTLQEGSFVIGRLLTREEWNLLENEQLIVVTDLAGEFIIRRIKSKLDAGFISLSGDHADKVAYPNIHLDVKDIRNICYVEWCVSAKMPNIENQYYHRLQRLEDKYEELAQSMHRKKSKE
jgi:phage repressor protein C with HTH and peptisase S24 domain